MNNATAESSKTAATTTTGTTTSKKKRGAVKRKARRARRAPQGKQLDVQRVFLRELLDVFDAQKQLTRHLPRISKTVQDQDFRELLTELESNLDRAGRSFQRVVKEHNGKGKQTQSTVCRPMRAMLQEANKGVGKGKPSSEQNLLTITNIQKMLHYMIASLGSLRSWSEVVEDEDAAILFRHLTDDAKWMDKELTAIAENELGARFERG
ncbi:MAG TPA: DUF892 family protein [Planctomycetota bacterium]|nr:DUF892 family protein [Planctomycetota bacterium]